MSSSSKNTKTATVAEMIHRFRTAPPTSRAVREAMKQNGDTASRMWYENQSYNHVENDTLETLLLSSSSLNSDNDNMVAESNCNELPCNMKGSNEEGSGSWRKRFQNGLSSHKTKNNKN